VLTPKITLHILRGRASQKSRVMTGATLLIGSESKCDVQMRAAAVAPRHCLITRREDGVVATRLSADHPMTVNGAPAAEWTLKDGDVLGIGPFALRLEFSQPEAVSVAEPPTEAPPMHRPRFALLDRKPAPAPTPEVNAVTKEHVPVPIESPAVIREREGR